MKTVAIFSLKGGTGRTTVACNLSAQLLQHGYATVVVDTDPQNAVGLHLGMEVGERFGLYQREATERDFDEYRKRQPTLVPHLPFGHASFEEIQELERRVLADPGFLNRRITELTPSDVDLVIIDTPVGASILTAPVVFTADLVLVVLQPDAACYATIPSTEELLLKRTTPAIVGYLINAMDGRKALCADVKGAMENMLRDYLLPFTIPTDEALREAFAQQTTLQNYASDSYASHAFRKLSHWIAGNLMDL